MKRRTEIIVETHEVIVIHNHTRLLRVWCRECAQQVIMLTVDQAAAVAKKSSRLIYRMAEAGYIHFAETPEGLMVICLQSLTSINCDDVNCPDQGDAKDRCEQISGILEQI